MIACSNGSSEVAEVLLPEQAEAETEAEDTLGWRPLHHAATNGHIVCLKLLIGKEAKVDSKTNSRETGLHLAAEHGHTELVKLLAHNSCPLNDRTYKELWKDEVKRSTALHLAAENNHIETVKCLLELGADVKIEDDGQKSGI
jgi:ankyrin repeat protein